MSPVQPTHAEALLAHATGLRSLARALAADEATAEDWLQETWRIALEKRPAPGPGLGRWLRLVLRRVASHQYRSEERRKARERAVARNTTSDDLAERKSAMQSLVDEVLAMDEPYQTALYLRFFEDRRVREIADLTGASVGTVSSRIHRGLEVLRERLDRRTSGGRAAWLSALAPIATPRMGGLLMSANTKLAVTAATMAILCALLWNAQSDSPPVHSLKDDSSVTTLESSRRREAIPAPEPKEGDTKAPTESTVTSRISSVVSEAPTSRFIPEVPELTTRYVKRSHKLEIRFQRSEAKSRVELNDGNELRTSFDWDYRRTLSIRDVYGWPNRHNEFQRSMTGSWSTSTEVFVALGSDIEQRVGSYRAKGKSPLQRQDLLFEVNGPGDRFAVKLERPIKKVDSREVLRDVKPQMDLRGLRPDGRAGFVSELEHPLPVLEELFAPGGDWKPEFRKLRTPQLRQWMPPRDALVSMGIDKGTVQLTPSGTVMEYGDAQELFEVAIEATFSYTVDTRELDLENEITELVLELRFVGSGEGKWNEQHRMITELALEGTVHYVQTSETRDFGRYQVEFPGKFTLDLKNSPL